MSNLQDIINLCTQEDGKVFIVGESGEVKLVMMTPQAYLVLKDKPASEPAVDPELVNKEIMRAQLEDVPITPPSVPVVSPKIDMREEVIDPSFDFDS